MKPELVSLNIDIQEDAIFDKTLLSKEPMF